MKCCLQGKIVRRILQVILIVVIFYFLAKNLYVNWNKIVEYDWNINYYFLTYSFVLLIVGSILIALGWNLILRGVAVIP